MKKSIFNKFSMLTMLLVAITFIATAQDEKPSPAKTAEGEVNGKKITINYSSPAVKGRNIWGDLVPFGQVWRAGANDATTIEFDKDVKIQGKDLPAGKYTFFVIPGEVESTFIFNKVEKQWGAYSYDQGQDALRVNVSSEQTSKLEERLVYEVTNNGFEIRWEYGKASAKVE
ncbi:DUF2911 domain-containing protein [Belliella kenyensis]|uniref:DUF2911 domain-containing protein n=1 Tax=Belliella kenyensis TaxID=1472724 RepID=A0ABV8EKP3_9BACT|nr:DUF2911 domain-containing protein [Belliella kenyensis]MCH7400245.1 DUF2911 domain-containing protein [Belliella kenyensis]MDN3604738.1 DUF2911 domain-containing protein [Belliella kenyensis]